MQDDPCLQTDATVASTNACQPSARTCKPHSRTQCAFFFHFFLSRARPLQGLSVDVCGYYGYVHNPRYRFTECSGMQLEQGALMSADASKASNEFAEYTELQPRQDVLMSAECICICCPEAGQYLRQGHCTVHPAEASRVSKTVAQMTESSHGEKLSHANLSLTSAS